MSEVCSGSKYALVRMDDGSEIIQFRSNYPPVSWETEEVEKVEDNKRYFVFGTYLGKNFSGSFAGCNATRWWRSFGHVKAPFSDPFVNPQNNAWTIEGADGGKSHLQPIFKGIYDDRGIGNFNFGRIGNVAADNDCVNTTSTRGTNCVKTVVRLSNGQFPNVDCRVKISDTRGLVYNKIFEDNCPEISHFCQGNNCPPDTCAVDCDDHICCYDNRGIAVKTIFK